MYVPIRRMRLAWLGATVPVRSGPTLTRQVMSRIQELTRIFMVSLYDMALSPL